MLARAALPPLLPTYLVSSRDSSIPFSVVPSSTLGLEMPASGRASPRPTIATLQMGHL